MKKMGHFFAFAAAMALCAGQVQGQEAQGMQAGYDYSDHYNYPVEDSQAYHDSGRAVNWSVVLPVGAAVIAAIVIANNHGHHHKHGGSGGGGGGRRHHSCSSSSLSHN